MSTKKLGNAADIIKPVAHENSYVNAVKKTVKRKIEDPPPGDLIVIQCYAGKAMAHMKVLIDHGSQSSAINEEALSRAGADKNIRPTNVKLTSAQGSVFEVKGRVGLELQIGTKDYECDLVVTPILLPGVDIILGNYFFSKYYTKLFTYPDKDPLFILENHVIPLVKSSMSDKDLSNYQVFNIAQIEEEVLGLARTYKPMIIPARQDGFIRVRLPKSVDKCKNLLFTPFELQRYEDLGLMECTIRPHQTNQGSKYGFVRYRNYSAYPYELPKKFALGEISAYDTIVDEDLVCMQDGHYVNAVKSYVDRWEVIQQQLLEKVNESSSEVRERLLRVFSKHQRTVNLPGEVLGTTDTVIHKIDYFGPDNNYTSPYTVPKSEREDLSKEIKSLVRQKKF